MGEYRSVVFFLVFFFIFNFHLTIFAHSQIKPNINDNEIFFETTSVTLLSTSVNNETNTKTVPQYFGIFYAKTKGFRIFCRNIQCICMSWLNL